jgi:hypothetical protein
MAATSTKNHGPSTVHLRGGGGEGQGAFGAGDNLVVTQALGVEVVLGEAGGDGGRAGAARLAQAHDRPVLQPQRHLDGRQPHPLHGFDPPGQAPGLVAQLPPGLGAGLHAGHDQRPHRGHQQGAGHHRDHREGEAPGH